MSKNIGIIISSNSEWRAVKSCFDINKIEQSPFGESFIMQNKLFMHGGCGKIDAAAATQHMISYWKPELIINLGTCGGIAGEVVVGDIILVERTVVYDIFEKMTDPKEAINAYSTDLDLSWLDSQYPLNLKRGLMHSADRDLSVEDIPLLKSKFGAKVVDWESGSIARICNKNSVPCLILRAVTDTVCAEGEHATYKKNHEDYRANTMQLIPKLVNSLPDWEVMFQKNYLK